MRAFLLSLVRAPIATIQWIGRHYQWLLTAMAMIVVTLFSAAITLRIALHGHEVTVPDLAGLTVSEASDAALRTGVDLNIENRFYSTTVPAGRILSQAPAAGSSVRHGWQVRVTESLGPQQVTIPDVVGESVRQASINVRKMELDLGTLAHIGAPGDPDVVLAQTPPPNAGVDQPRVNLLLSSTERASDEFVMPSFVGMSFAAADHMALELSLRVASLDTVPLAVLSQATGPNSASSSTPSGIVLSQSPESGYKARKGDVVRFTLHSDPAAPNAPSTKKASLDQH
jgi:beta-lactam-binding protein with PASTA domain